MAQNITQFPGGFANGVSIRGVPLLQAQPGNVFWLSNSPVIQRGCVAGADRLPGTFNRPFQTLAGALLQCQQGNGDVIIIKAGHKETISSATALALSVAGVAIIGLGIGNMRPTFTLDTAATANIPVQAANMTIQNCLFIANFADIASIFTSLSCSVTASIAIINGQPVMTVTVLGSGTVFPGMNLAGTGVKPGTLVLSQLSGTTGGVGTYLVSVSATVASTTITGLTNDFAIDLCEFKDTSSILNALTVFTGAATANSVDGFQFTRNRISSLGTTAATTALKVSTDQKRIKITGNFGCSAVLNDTAALLAAGTAQLTDLDIGANVWERPNTSSTGGSFVSGTGNAWTGHAYDNYFYQVDNTAGIWIATGHGSSFGYSNNFSPITGAVDKSALINPAAV